jgi:NADH:ubiquinone oxidoreductase subunit C
MEKQEIKEKIVGLGINAEFDETKQYLELVVPAEAIHETALKLKNSPDLQLDFLLSVTAVDWENHFSVVYHLTSSELYHVIVVKVKLNDHENPEIDTLMDIWATAEYQEREVFDLYGIKFRNHTDLRRLFLEDGWGFPLRKDYTDERIIELKR